MTLLGLVGVGRIGAFHAATLTGLSGVEVVIADAQAGRAEALAGSLGARWAPDVGTLLDQELAGLVVATPTGSHAELIDRGVAAGIPVFCEKPVAETSARTVEIVKSVDKHGGRVQIGFQRRFDSGFAAARAEVERGALGRVHTLCGQTCDPAPPPAAYLATSGGADVLVLAAVTGQDGYDSRPELDDFGWRRLFWNLDRLRARAAETGIRACLHPHAGTMIETGADVDRLLEHSSTPLCLDTGHLVVGGGDPVRVAREAPERIMHVHLKDVDAAVAARVRDGELTYHDAVRAGLYTRLGEGDADIAGVVGALEGNAYQGWYVLEQDTVLDSEPEDGAGPLAAVRAGVAYLESLP
jgi:sugar phosphate isomerase/epimerase